MIYESFQFPWGTFTADRRTLFIDPNGNTSLTIFDASGFDRVRYDFTGRIDPEAIDPTSPPPIANLVDVDPSTTGSIKPTAPGYEPPIRAGDPGGYVTTRDFNVDGRPVEEIGPGYYRQLIYDEMSADIFQRGNLLREDRLPVDGSSGLISVILNPA